MNLYSFLASIVGNPSDPKKELYEKIKTELEELEDKRPLTQGDELFEYVETNHIRLRAVYLRILDWKRKMLHR